MKSKEIVYISGKITAPTPGEVDQNIEAGVKKAAELARDGYAPLSPHGNSRGWHNYHDFTWRDYMRIDLELLKRSDTVYMMSNWHESRGARVEERYARLLRKKVIYESGENS